MRNTTTCVLLLLVFITSCDRTTLEEKWEETEISTTEDVLEADGKSHTIVGVDFNGQHLVPEQRVTVYSDMGGLLAHPITTSSSPADSLVLYPFSDTISCTFMAGLELGVANISVDINGVIRTTTCELVPAFPSAEGGIIVETSDLELAANESATITANFYRLPGDGQVSNGLRVVFEDNHPELTLLESIEETADATASANLHSNTAELGIADSTTVQVMVSLLDMNNAVVVQDSVSVLYLPQ